MDNITNRISEDQRNQFQFLLDRAKDSNLALVYTEMDGKPVTVVTFVQFDPDTNEYVMNPLAVMVDDNIMNRLADPDSVREKDKACSLQEAEGFDAISQAPHDSVQDELHGKENS